MIFQMLYTTNVILLNWKFFSIYSFLVFLVCFALVSTMLSTLNAYGTTEK